MSDPFRIGEILQAAALISSFQIEVALRDQALYPHLRLGEILALRGWIKKETADFFGQEWSELLRSERTHPMGYFLQKAALLNEPQINAILKEQKQLGLKFGAVAVLRGYLKQETVDFLIAFLFPEQQFHSPWTTFPKLSAQPKKQVEVENRSPSNDNKSKTPSQSLSKSSDLSDEIIWLG